MTETLSADSILRLRMHALGLSTAFAEDPSAPADTNGSGANRIASTVSRMLALQGQDWPSSRWALGLRTPGTTVDDVHDALNSGLVVRSWPMRGTVHLLSAEDIAWMQRATNHRVLAGAARRREFLGITDPVLDALVDVSMQALAGGNSLDRDELSAVWTESGIEWKNNWRYHLIWWMCQNGLTVLGPVAERGEPRIVRADEWIASPRDLRGDAALQELASRYAVARGVVSAQDLAWWSGLTVREARAGLAHAVAAGQLVEVTAACEDTPTTMWADPRALDAPASAQDDEWLLLPAFDEHLLGYQNRAPQLAPEQFDRIVPGRNGMFLATVVRNGRVIGTWKKGTRRGEGLIGTPMPGESLGGGLSELGSLAQEWGAFHGLKDTPFGTPHSSA